MFVIATITGLLLGFVFATSKFFASLDTWLHEYGHAVAAAALGGQPSKIRIDNDMSGVTHFWFRRNIKTRNLVVAAAGPIASVFTLIVATRMALAGTSRTFLVLVSFLVASILVTTVRSVFGWLVGLTAIALATLAVTLDGGLILGVDTSNSSLILLTLCVSGSAGVAFRESIRRIRWDSADGDEGKIATILGLPEKLIDLLMIAIHIACLALVYLGIQGLGIDWPSLAESLDLGSIWQTLVTWWQQVSP